VWRRRGDGGGWGVGGSLSSSSLLLLSGLFFLEPCTDARARFLSAQNYARSRLRSRHDAWRVSNRARRRTSFARGSLTRFRRAPPARPRVPFSPHLRSPGRRLSRGRCARGRKAHLVTFVCVNNFYHRYFDAAACIMEVQTEDVSSSAIDPPKIRVNLST
jgi:hypothetical protein